MATTVESHAIAIHCSCGRRGSVSGRFAGRKVRCTGCGEAVRVPGLAAGGPPTTARTQSGLASAPAAPAIEPVAESGLELLPPVERKAPDLERRGRAPRRGRSHAATRRGHRPRVNSADERRRDLDTEAHLRALAFWQLLGGALGVFGALLFALTSLGSQAPAGVVLVMAGLMCAASMISAALGYFLWTYHGVARVVYMVFSAIAMLSNLVQFVTVPGVGKLFVLCAAAWSTAIFMVVAGARAAYVCTPEYRALVLRTRSRVRWWASPFFWLPIVLGVLAIGATVLLVAAAVGSAF